MADEINQNNGIQFQLQSAAFPSYAESDLYNSGKKRPPDRSKFYVQTVDDYGNPKPYTVNGLTILGLILTINPSTVSINASKIVNRTQTMTGWVEDHWGEDLDTITFQGSSAAFMWHGPDAGIPKPQGPLKQTPQQITDTYNNYAGIQGLGIVEPVGTGRHSGLAVTERRNTATYQEFRKLMQLMNGNGATFDVHGLVESRLYIQVMYDYACYRGYFESFDLTESSDSPYRFTYTITYKAEKTMYTYMK